MWLLLMSVTLLYLALGFVCSVVLVRLVIPVLNRMNVLDLTEERVQTCVHAPTPRGGGWGVTPVIALLWLSIWYLFPDPSYRVGMLAMLALFIPLTWISWMDDRTQAVPVRTRMLVQSFAVAIPILLLPPDTTVCLGYLPLWLDRAVTILGWWWFMNLFNFMDGLNGISGVEAATIGLGVFLCAYFNKHDLPLSLMGLAFLGGAAGWLVWNWRYDALAFLGDVGSVGLGYFGGWILIMLATKGHFFPAALISLYYCMDATTTLIYKIKRGVPIWQAERAHFYHAGTIPGALNAIQATMRLVAVNIVLLILAFCASRYQYGWAYLPAGILVCVWLMWHYKQHEKRVRNASHA